jgi:hypothetical protein
MTWTHARFAAGGYELSSRGDRRFSAIFARLSDGRTIEEAYQLDVKGFRAISSDWRAGKGRPPLRPVNLYAEYLALWKCWAAENPTLLRELATVARGRTLTDCFASSPVSQARAIAEILNEWQL